MAIQNQGWAYVSGSGASGTPGGADTNIQFNNAGALGGSSDLTWDGSTVATTDISASINISASAFYGDGSNLTGVTASAVNVADGPEFAIQFRVDTPVSGEISGSSALMFLTGSNTLSGTYAAFTAVTASTIVGGSPLTISSSATQVYGPMQIQSGESLSFNGASNTAKITNNGSNLDFNSPGSIVLNSGNNNVSSSANISASAFYGDGSALTNLPGGGGGGIFTELDSSNAYTTSSLSVGTSDAPGATLHVSSSGDEALFRVDGLTETAPALFVTGSGRVGIGIEDPAVALEIDGHITFGTGTGGGYLANRGSESTRLRFGADDATSIALECGGVQLLLVDNDSPDKVILGAAADNNIIVSGSLIVSGTIESNTLTSGRVLLAGTDGVLEDNSDIVYNGSVLKVMSKDGFSGSIYTQTGSFAVLNAAATGYLASVGSDGQISASSDMHTAGILNVQGAANLNGNTTVEGNLTANNGLDVSGAQSNFATSVSITGSSDVGLNVSSVFTGGASILSTGNILAGHTGGGAHTAHMNSDGEISGSAIQGASLSVDGDIRCGTGLQTLGSQQISFGTKLTGYTNTIASPFYRVYPVDTSALTGSTMVILPAISAATHGLELTIKDIGNNAGTYAINVTGATGSGDKIETSTAYKAIAGNNWWSTIVAQSGSSGTHVWYQIAGRAW